MKSMSVLLSFHLVNAKVLQNWSNILNLKISHNLCIFYLNNSFLQVSKNSLNKNINSLLQVSKYSLLNTRRTSKFRLENVSLSLSERDAMETIRGCAHATRREYIPERSYKFLNLEH